MTGFAPPPYPYDRLSEITALAEGHRGGAVDLSVGTPCDPPPERVVAALGSSGLERGYPISIGSPAYREAAAGWMRRRFDVEVDPGDLAACVGTKELVASLPHLLRLRDPDRDTVLYPAVAYPTYAMGASLAACRAVPVPVGEDWTLDLAAIEEADAARALCLWVNSPANPTGALDDLAAAAAWARARAIPLLSDECYVEFTWSTAPRSVLQSGAKGVLAVHSLSKRSNFAGGRAGFYAGDPALVRYLAEVRKHQGLIVPGPVQAAGALAWADDDHVDAQRARYHRRLGLLVEGLRAVGLPAVPPAGAFYLWVPAPGGDAWRLAHELAGCAGMVVSPGEFYGRAAPGHVRIAAVQPDERIELAIDRLSDSGMRW